MIGPGVFGKEGKAFLMKLFFMNGVTYNLQLIIFRRIFPLIRIGIK